MENKPFSCAKTGKLPAETFGGGWGNEDHNFIAFQFCQPPFTGMYPLSPWVLLSLTQDPAYFPYILVIQLKVPEYITGKESFPMDTIASFGAYFYQEEHGPES